ncbi:MAG: hypothetical protein LBR98_02505 [Syntrophomonadaceae bacterium]|jgi:hypothetical protein|nr:hypothetical protein [Syntrophomonadaceae bacterium]
MENYKLYDEMRSNALKITPEEIGLVLDDDKQVYASLIDMEINGTTVSLVCIFDSSVSLYYSNGRMDLGLGENPDIMREATTFLINSGQCLDKMKIIDKPESIEGSDIHFYLKGRKGIYTAAYRVNSSENSRECQFLFFLLQKVLSAIREEQLS